MDYRELASIAKELNSCCRNATAVYKGLKHCGADKYLPGYEMCLNKLNRAIERYKIYDLSLFNKMTDLRKEGKTIEDKEVIELFEIYAPDFDIEKYR